MTSIAKTLAAALLATLFATASAFAQAVTVDYDHSVNFLKFKSYSLQKVHATDPGVEDRATIALNRNLKERYLHSVDSDPDLIIGLVEANTDTNEYTSFYSSLSGLDWQRGWGAGGFMDATAGVGDIPAGTLILNMWDGKTKKLIWRGMLTLPPAVTSSGEADQKMDKAVGQVIAQFPPKYKKS